jgi:hypothetical protein
MKKFIIGMVVLVLLFVGISWASENNDIQIYKAENFYNDAGHTWGIDGQIKKFNKGHIIYLRLIYQEEKKQTKLMEQILVKLNNGVEK